MSANDKARTSNDVLSGSVNSIIGQLMRQKKAFEDVGKSTLDYIAADKKSTAETREHAIALMGEVAALKQLAEWRQKNAATANASRTYDERIASGVLGTTLTPTQQMANADAARRARRQKELDEVFGLDPERHAARRIELERRTAERIAEEQERVQNASQVRQDRRLAESQARQTELMARRRAAANAMADDDYGLVDSRGQRSRRQREQDALDNSLVTGALMEKGYFRGRNGHENETRGTNAKWAGVEGFRAFEDFIQGSAYGGFRGGILAASNNISQMGAAFGAMAAMGGSAISALVLLGSNAYEAWRKTDQSTRKASEAVKEYSSHISNVVSHFERMARIDLKGRAFGPGVTGSKDFDASREARRREQEEIKLEQDTLDRKMKEERIQNTAMGLAGMTPAQIRDSRDRISGQVRQYHSLERSRRAGLQLETDETGAQFQRVNWRTGELAPNEAARRRDLQMREANPEALKDEHIKELEMIQKLNRQKQEELAARKKWLQDSIKHHEVLETIEMAKGQAEADLSEARRRSHEVGGRGPISEWEQMDIERSRRNAEHQRDSERFTRGQSWMQSRSEDLLLSGMLDPKDQTAYRAEKEHQESLRRSAEAEKRGIMTPDERARMDKASMEKRDRDMREAKYGNLQADGNSGFGSADIKSTQGFNAVIKAMRYAEQDKTIQELKKNGDIAAEQLASQQRVEELLKMAPLPLVDFN